MNTNGLAKLYDKLTPRERLPMIAAASLRDDQAEWRRLADSAPMVNWRLPDYHGLGEGIQLLLHFHIAELLDLAANYWQAAGRHAEYAALEDEDDPTAERLYKVQCMFAYLFLCHCDAWRLVAKEMHLDADLLLGTLPGYSTVMRTEGAARLMALTADEATAFLRERGEGDEEVITVDDCESSARLPS
jgi:hypothetical protein